MEVLLPTIPYPSGKKNKCVHTVENLNFSLVENDDDDDDDDNDKNDVAQEKMLENFNGIATNFVDVLLLLLLLLLLLSSSSLSL